MCTGSCHLIWLSGATCTMVRHKVSYFLFGSTPTGNCTIIPGWPWSQVTINCNGEFKEAFSYIYIYIYIYINRNISFSLWKHALQNLPQSTFNVGSVTHFSSLLMYFHSPLPHFSGQSWAIHSPCSNTFQCPISQYFGVAFHFRKTKIAYQHIHKVLIRTNDTVGPRRYIVLHPKHFLSPW